VVWDKAGRSSARAGALASQIGPEGEGKVKYYVIAVRDRSADIFGVPSCVVNLGGAIRNFGDEVNRADDNNLFYKHPEDFDLYSLGTYDDATAQYECGVPKQIAVGKDFAKKQNGQG
jgi:hypothetical protein